MERAGKGVAGHRRRYRNRHRRRHRHSQTQTQLLIHSHVRFLFPLFPPLRPPPAPSLSLFLFVPPSLSVSLSFSFSLFRTCTNAHTNTQTFTNTNTNTDTNISSDVQCVACSVTAAPATPAARWERTPRCRCIRWSMQPAACVRVHGACARFVGMFVHAQANRVIEHKTLVVCVSGPCFFGLFL